MSDMTISLKSPVSGCPICILWGGGQTRLSAQPAQISCDGMGLAGSKGQPLGLICACFVRRDIPLSEKGSRYQHIFKINFQISFEGHNQNLQKNPFRFKSEWNLYDEYQWSWKDPFGVFFSYSLWISLGSDWCKHCSGHSMNTEACTAGEGRCVVLRPWGSLVV